MAHVVIVTHKIDSEYFRGFQGPGQRASKFRHKSKQEDRQEQDLIVQAARVNFDFFVKNIAFFNYTIEDSKITKISHLMTFFLMKIICFDFFFKFVFQCNTKMLTCDPNPHSRSRRCRPGTLTPSSSSSSTKSWDTGTSSNTKTTKFSFSFCCFVDARINLHQLKKERSL